MCTQVVGALWVLEWGKWLPEGEGGSRGWGGPGL